MTSLPANGSQARPIGYFVHHQGRGHAERCAALVNALPDARPVTIFCARDDIFPPLREGVEIRRIPSLFEPTGDEETGGDWVPTPDTLHCAPLGWPGIREAMAAITGWFAEARPLVMVCDVSAEIAQLCRICSVPHVKVLQHGDRSDPGHRAAYDGAAGLLAPFDARLAQHDWSASMLARCHFAPGLGVPVALPGKTQARAALGIADDEELILAVSGGGGSGMAQAPLGVGARAMPAARWVTIGQVQRDWHATEPANLDHMGWVENAGTWIAAADLVIASTGNTTCQQILAASKPWIAVPEWRYFDEQVAKAEALARAGAAIHLPHLPGSAHAWRAAVSAARGAHDPRLQASMIAKAPAQDAARWLEALGARLVSGGTAKTDTVDAAVPSPSNPNPPLIAVAGE
ncbi:glycosyltransferase [Profundibacterium mesophilum]|uniref:Pyrophosphoryl-undecaprenol N-acetylglucosamine transferase n=1 Tax=Profundibacterium mesophilum KAUST100406-0324 TaxID=1037889 RepID=A0A921NPG5_9RHOB|nr:glycosyltransferase [Profundibacterium mesophilum]KAF0676011.1 pyrophosphoryl-undecaprenol N-acetylglucosamine transferase [Profundibacterium mesophilum KAUST100406-0324]